MGPQWWFWYGYASNPTMQKDSEAAQHDRIRARQRVRAQIQFIADENLSAMLGFEHNMHWGNSNVGSIGNNYSATGGKSTFGGLNADAGAFGIKRAHLDWTIPGTQIKTRMGMQGINMPGVAANNPVLNADVAGVSVSTQFTPELGLTVFWARPYDQDYDDDATGSLNDEMDVFGVMLPIKTDIIRATPWGMFATIGADSGFDGNGGGPGASSLNYGSGRLPDNNVDLGYGTAYGWWLGTTVELPILDPFFVKLDAIYGAIDAADQGEDISGWYVAGDIGYKFSWGALSVLGLYSSGNSDDDDYGQLPIISADGAYNMGGLGGMNGLYGLGGGDWRRYDGYLSTTGQGLWGLGLKVANVSFVEKLQHTLIGMWYGGTNDGESVTRKNPNTRLTDSGSGIVFGNRQLSTSDHAWELTLLNEYKVNDNLSFRFDVGYIQMELGDSWNDKDDTEGNFFSGIGVRYQF